jgi:hypothetical protein
MSHHHIVRRRGGGVETARNRTQPQVIQAFEPLREIHTVGDGVRGRSRIEVFSEPIRDRAEVRMRQGLAVSDEADVDGGTQDRRESIQLATSVNCWCPCDHDVQERAACIADVRDRKRDVPGQARQLREAVRPFPDIQDEIGEKRSSGNKAITSSRPAAASSLSTRLS